MIEKKGLYLITGGDYEGYAGIVGSCDCSRCKAQLREGEVVTVVFGECFCAEVEQEFLEFCADIETADKAIVSFAQGEPVEDSPDWLIPAVRAHMRNLVNRNLKALEAIEMAGEDWTDAFEEQDREFRHSSNENFN